jgi:non-ribosomal peptide synthetase component E (peptide arylation enzyme)
VAIVGVPDPLLGEKICACVVTIEGHQLTLESITAYLRNEQRVAVYKLPEYLLLVAALPRNPVGKILKRDLRELAKTRIQTVGRGATPLSPA